MSRTLKAGIFISVIVFVLIMSWMWLANIKIRGNTQVAIIHFPDVTGLKINDPIKVWGIEKGNVKGIKFKRDHIEVKILLDREVTLYTDAFAEILDVAMISGTKYIALDPGRSGTPLSPGTPLPGKASLGIPLSVIGDLGDKASKILSVIESAELMQSLSSILRNLEEATARLSQIVKENQADLRKTTKYAMETTSTLKDMGEKFSIVATHADSLISDIKKGKGTLGKLASDDTLYQELTSTLASLRELAQDIKTNPRRYIKIF